MDQIIDSSNQEISVKPAVKSMGVWTSISGGIASLLILAQSAGQIVTDPQVAALLPPNFLTGILAAAGLASNALSLWARLRATHQIEGLFRSR